METKAKKVAKMKAELSGSEGAKRLAAGVLEVLSGERGPNEVSEALGVSSMRYYALEDRALRGMVRALEPAPRGRRAASPEDALAKAEKERDRLQRELGRAQALLRLVRKSVKLEGKVDPKRKPRRRSKGRARKVIARLVKPVAPAPPVEKAEG